MQYPKYKTGHYNSNGLNVYTRQPTIIVFAIILCYVFAISAYKLLPFLISLIKPNLYISTKLERIDLSNPFNLKANLTDPSHSFYRNFWLPMMVTDQLEK
jgi:hypothetical protein